MFGFTDAASANDDDMMILGIYIYIFTPILPPM